MTEESHRDAMNDAIRAQRERANVPKSVLPHDDEPTPEPEPEPAQMSLLERLLDR